LGEGQAGEKRKRTTGCRDGPVVSPPLLAVLGPAPPPPLVNRASRPPNMDEVAVGVGGTELDVDEPPNQLKRSIQSETKK